MASDKDDRISELVPADPPIYTCPHCSESFDRSEWDIWSMGKWFSNKTGPTHFTCRGCGKDTVGSLERLMVQPIYCCDCEFCEKIHDQSACRLAVTSRSFVTPHMTLELCEKINRRGQCKDYKVKEEVKD